MVHIILLILKTAGIVFLSLLGIVLLLLAAILFLPVTYRVYAEKEEKIKVHAAGGWMFRMLSVHYRLDETGRDFVVCFLGIPIYRPGKEKRSSRSSKKKRKTSLPHKQLTESKPECGAGEESSRVHASEQNEEPAAAADTLADLKEEKGADRKRTDRKRGFFGRLAYAIHRICDRIKTIWNACRKIPRTVRSLLDRKDQLLEFWDLEEHRRAREAIWKEFLYLRDKIRPRKILGYIHFGFDDPAVTGICMGAASVLYSWYPEKFELRPDFDRQVLEGEIFFRGKLRLYVLVMIGLRIWFNRDIRLMYEHWKEL